MIRDRSSARHARDAKLPVRDWFLLPIIGLMTIGAISAGLTFVGRYLFSASESTTLPCLILNDPTTGVRAIPNSTCRQKVAESAMVEYRFNSCGHRDPLECRSKAVGAYRIVMIGSSFSLGMYVSREDTFAALLPKELSHRTGRKTELYNESMQWGFPASAALRLDDVFAAKPDLILWLLTPADIQNASIVWSSSSDVTAVPDAVKRAGFLARAWYRLKMSFATNTDQTAFGAFWRNGVALFRASPVGILLQHILYASQSLYINSYLSGPDSEVGFLRTNPSVVWQKHLQDMEGVASRIEQRAAAAGVPLVAALLPTRAQAAMISSGQWPSDFDPYEIDEELRAIILKVGGTYIDILPRMQKIPNSEKYYFAVDTHPNARGHSLFAALLTDELTSGSVPVLEPRSFRPN